MTMIPDKFHDELEVGLHRMEIELNEAQRLRLLDYLALLVKWNQAYNLTAVRDPSEMISRHLLDSLSVMPYIEGERWLDVGSGGGMPGVPMAIANPEKRWVLLDSNGKKTRFLTQVKMTLSLSNVTVEQRRVEDYRPDQAFDGIISRAFSNLSDFCDWTRHLGDNRTLWLAMKGPHPDEELKQLPADFQLQREHLLTVPDSPAQRHLLILRLRATEKMKTHG